MTDLRTGDCYSFHVEHPAGTLLVHPSANYLPGVLTAHPADTVYLGIGALGKQPPAFREAYWKEVVAATGATRVVAIHWDNFTRSLDRPLQALPPRFDDVHTSLEFLSERCADSGIALVLPRLWGPADPFAPVGDHHR
ncbi:hypothetical protein RDV89_02980 [Nocardioides zeae]|uniref:Metallo-beta-lactamase domain-containing protein n=1 Tax=Nocardioides imazamoxiresistens TaxID=3231893 RepID=A0ABU3PS06_9ACTN|nr:hypothetical protein [Nocardioides zeae]MDT9592014.1 hypothetical protein [Nocardioides zeae]